MKPAIRTAQGSARTLSTRRALPSSTCIFCAHATRQPSSRSETATTTTPASSIPRRSVHGARTLRSPSAQDLQTAADERSLRTFYDFFREALPDGPPPQGRFNVDLKALRAEFLRLQALTHPDRHAAADKAKAEALSARVNEAYKTLQDPLLRTQYLLSLRGIDVAGDEAAKLDDEELLLAVLDTREVIEDAADEGELKFVRERNDKNMRETLDDLEEAFEKDDLEVARREAVRLRYWVNIKQSIDDWEPGKPVVLSH